MKIIRRVSLHKGLERMIQPAKSSPKLDRWDHNKLKEYYLDSEKQLYKYGFRFKTYNLKFILSGLAGLMLGILFDTFDRMLMNNQIQTIYFYKSKEKTHSSTYLYLRKFIFNLLIENISGNLFIQHELSQFLSKGPQRNGMDQKIIRYRQYKNYMAKRDNKYDFLELGVLEKFPYPTQEEKGDKPM